MAAIFKMIAVSGMNVSYVAMKLTPTTILIGVIFISRLLP